MVDKVAAGIVLFYPDKERLRKCLDSLRKQVPCIIIFDNSTNETSVFNDEKDIIYLTHHKNYGVSFALNEIFKKGRALGFEWIITMDQDTIVPDSMVSNFSKYFAFDNVGIICPQVIDKRRKYMYAEEPKEDISFIDSCITSASCTKISIWEEIGGFDNFLFIDFVDTDYCKRLILNGYKIIRCNHIVIDQQFGNISLKSTFVVKFYVNLSNLLKNKNIAKLSYHKEVSPLRVYFVHRNLLYLNKKFKNYGGIGYENFYCHSFAGFLLYFSLPSLLRGSKKIKILKAIVEGLFDGWKASRKAVFFKPNK